MATCENPVMRAVAANHPRLSTLMLAELLMDEDVSVRRAAVKNPNMTEGLLHLALADSDLGIAGYARLLAEEN